MDLFKDFKKLSYDSAIYTSGILVSKGLIFLMLPIYSRVFTSSDYGRLDLILIVSAIVGEVSMLGLNTVMSLNFFKKSNEKELKKLISSILMLKIIWMAIVFISYLIVINILQGYLDLISNEVATLLIVGLLAALAQQIFFQGAEVYRLKEQPKVYIGITISFSIISLSVVLYLLLVKQYNIEAVLLGNLVGAIILAFGVWASLSKYLSLRNINFSEFPNYIKVGAPLVPAGIAFFGIEAADRFFILYLMSPNDIGVYAMAAKISLIASVLVEAFRKAVWPKLIKEIHLAKTEFIKVISNIFIFSGILLSLIIFLLSPLIYKYVVDDSYTASASIIGLLCLSKIAYGFYLISTVGIFKSEKTYLSMYVTLVAAVLACILNYILIPHFGLIGASIATLITYLVWNMLALAVGNRFLAIDHPYINISGFLLAAITIMLIDNIYVTISGTLIFGVLTVIYIQKVRNYE